MNKIFVFFILSFLHQICLSQINLTLDARQIKPVKLSDISSESCYVVLNIDSIIDIIVTDDFLFISKGAFWGDKVYQFDYTGKLIRAFGDQKGFWNFSFNTEKNMLTINYKEEIKVWDLNGTFLKTIKLPESTIYPSQILGFKQNDLYILQLIKQNNNELCRIHRMNYETGEMEMIIEKMYPFPKIVMRNAWLSSFECKLHVGFHDDNVIYEINGNSERPAIKYKILNYPEEKQFDIYHKKMFVGQYLHILYDRTMFYWYDMKERKEFQVRGGIDDDIFRTGKIDNFQINDNFLLFSTKRRTLKEINIGNNQTAIFIVKIK